MGSGLRAHQAPAEAALDRREAHGSIGQSLELGDGGQIRRQLAPIGQGKAMLHAEACGDGTGQDHRLSHQLPGGARFCDLQLGLPFVVADAALRQIHQQSTAGQAPLAAAFQQPVEVGEIRILGGCQIDQFIGIVVTEPVGGFHPAALNAGRADLAGLVQLHPKAPGGGALSLPQAERAIGELLGEHRQVADRQIEAAAAAARLKIQR